MLDMVSKVIRLTINKLVISSFLPIGKLRKRIFITPDAFDWRFKGREFGVAMFSQGIPVLRNGKPAVARGQLKIWPDLPLRGLTGKIARFYAVPFRTVLD